MKIRPILQIENPRPVKESHTCFLSPVPSDGGGYHSAYREFTPYNPTRPHNDMYSCSVRYQKYDADFRPIGDSHLLRELLQDPRCFIWRGRPYALAVDDTTRGFSVYTNVVIDLSTGEWFELTTPAIYAGKNWMPVPDGDRLYFVRSVEPLCVVECDAKWECTPVTHRHLASNPWIGSYRGGAAAKMADGVIYGVGHRTLNPGMHTPYSFKIKMDSNEVTVLDMEPEGFSESILDPTSIIDRGIVLACSSKAWHHHDVQIPTRLCQVIDG